MKARRNLGLVFASIGVALLAAEGLLRLYLAVVPPPPQSAYIRDPDAVYHLRPSGAGGDPDPEHYINSLGFHDREHASPKPARTLRILGIGDSFVYSRVPLPQNFLRVAESLLTQRLAADSLRVDMVLMGLGGYSPENEVGVLGSAGLGLDPDVAILNFFVGNDILGIGVRGEVIRGQLYYVGSSYPALHLLRKSRLFLLGEYVFLTRIKAAIVDRPGRAARRAAEGAAPTSNPQTAPVAPPAGGGTPGGVTPGYVHIEKKNLPVYRRVADKRMLAWWKKAEDYILEFDRLCQEAEIPWVLNLIPEEIQVDPQVRAQVLQALSLVAEDYDFDNPQRRLRQFAAANHILCLDPLLELRAAHRPEARLYVPNDTHWNERGNRLMGEILAGFILEENLLPAAAPAPTPPGADLGRQPGSTP